MVGEPGIDVAQGLMRVDRLPGGMVKGFPTPPI